MSKKYVIDLPDDAQYILINGASENHCYTRIEQVDDLEELNSDYINEHYGELQDEAYQRGFDDAHRISEEEYQRGLEDGKRKAEDGCTGCKYEGNAGEHLPCEYCMNNFTNQWTAKPSDRIEVGDIVDVYGKIGVVTYVYKNTFNVMMYDGSTGRWRREDLKKTGKHYDIASILEAMRNDR